MLTSEDAAVEGIPLARGDEEDKEQQAIDSCIEEDAVSCGVVLAMTCGMGGLQVVWSTIFSNGTIYLQAIGLNDAWTSAVWSMPAVCGFLVQPIVGAYSDSFQHPYGRRRPFIVVGACGIIVSITTLAWAGSLGRWTAAIAVLHDVEVANLMAKAYAVLAIFTLSLSIQPLQCGLRALVLDLCPARQQAQAQSWAVRFSGAGQVLGCIAGLVYHPDGRDSFGDVTNFRILSTASIVAVGVTVVCTCFGVKELPGPHGLSEKHVGQSLLDILRNLILVGRDTRGMLRRVFLIQGLSWMGWFGFLFYNTSHISNLYSLSSRPGNRGQTSSHLGSFVTLLFSVVGFTATILLPLILGLMLRIQSQTRHENLQASRQGTRCSSLLVLWSIGLVFSALLMLMVSMTRSWKLAMAATAANGVSWAITNWVPFTLIGHVAREPGAYGPFASNNVALHSKGPEQPNGMISGLHNVAISAPQVVAAAICGVVLEMARGMGSVYGAGWVLGAGGLGYLAAGCLAFSSSRSEMFDFGDSHHDLG